MDGHSLSLALFYSLSSIAGKQQKQDNIATISFIHDIIYV
jgi:hypothetical protein